MSFNVSVEVPLLVRCFIDDDFIDTASWTVAVVHGSEDPYRCNCFEAWVVWVPLTAHNAALLDRLLMQIINELLFF